MKPPSKAPIYMMMYRGLCDIARKHGYALAVHGSMNCDLDVVAIPWVESPHTAKEVATALHKHVLMCGYDEKPNLVERGLLAERKPHGRKAWKFHYKEDLALDISVMPTLKEITE